MKIKGVGTGKSKGNPIEYAPEEKSPFAVKDAIVAASPEGERWWSEKVVITKMSFTAKELPTKQKGYASNYYLAEGTVILRRLELAKDRYKRAEEKKFHIEFEDALDEIGMPDLKVTKFDIK